MIERERDETFVDVNRPASLRGYDHKQYSYNLSTDTGKETLVQQHFANDVDINVIMRRFGVSRQLPLGAGTGVYGDFSGIEDYASAVDRIEGARERFMKFPPEFREKFDNDPGKLIAAAQALSEEDFTSRYLVSEPVVPVDSGSGS